MQTPPARILHASLDGGIDLYVSDPLIDEVMRTLQKPYFTQRVRPDFVFAIVATLQDSARQVEISVQIEGAATHPEDDLILATALSADAEVLVTGDRQLQQLGTFQGVAILSPTEFIAFLDQQSERRSGEEGRTI